MNIFPIHSEIEAYLKKRALLKRFFKQVAVFKNNPFHPSLKTELLEPRNMKLWSFRINQKYRAIFIFRAKDTVEILDVNNHYQ